MKTKFIITVALLGLLMTSCIKDYMGHANDKVVLTSDNYLYEGDLFQVYLDQKVAKLDVSIAALKDIIANNQADETTLNKLIAAEEARDNFISQEASIISLEQVGRTIPKPRPPCPKPRNCDFSTFEYVLAPNTVKEIKIEILNNNGKTIGGGNINDLSPLSGTGGLILFSKLRIDSYKEPITISVEVIDQNGIDRSYIVAYE